MKKWVAIKYDDSGSVIKYMDFDLQQDALNHLPKFKGGDNVLVHENTDDYPLRYLSVANDKTIIKIPLPTPEEKTAEADAKVDALITEKFTVDPLNKVQFEMLLILANQIRALENKVDGTNKPPLTRQQAIDFIKGLRNN